MGGWVGKLLGNKGERTAARYLRKQGYKILSRQYSNRAGEIDLIALDSETVVFVEVKTRSSARHGDPVDAVSVEKQRRLTRTALIWLKAKGLLEQRSRFDVIAILWPEQGRKPEIRHYQSAFEPNSQGQMFA